MDGALGGEGGRRPRRPACTRRPPAAAGDRAPPGGGGGWEDRPSNPDTKGRGTLGFGCSEKESGPGRGGGRPVSVFSQPPLQNRPTWPAYSPPPEALEISTGIQRRESTSPPGGACAVVLASSEGVLRRRSGAHPGCFLSPEGEGGVPSGPKKSSKNEIIGIFEIFLPSEGIKIRGTPPPRGTGRGGPRVSVGTPPEKGGSTNPKKRSRGPPAAPGPSLVPEAAAPPSDPRPRGGGHGTDQRGGHGEPPPSSLCAPNSGGAGFESQTARVVVRKGGKRTRSIAENWR